VILFNGELLLYCISCAESHFQSGLLKQTGYSSNGLKYVKVNHLVCGIIVSCCYCV
jgi:hypothetical protein